ncbi:hypothetical protein OSB04_007018 [Centaurea solstitialis]|uniref:RNA-directed DNA polymerase, eukaryota n=1 Tax=Centaurea solstitialis TaxID=347529 RepID=A0AA38TRP9_9ASTR|nr:hypothetical protein OSB04_007018 [Centaurea solstitialis]
MEAIERKAETVQLSPSDLSRRQESSGEIKDIERANILDLKQRARLKWAIEGDENSRFFHGLINRLSVNGQWISDPGQSSKKPQSFLRKNSPIVLPFQGRPSVAAS